LVSIGGDPTKRWAFHGYDEASKMVFKTRLNKRKALWNKNGRINGAF